jgi:hypothetical protein
MNNLAIEEPKENSTKHSRSSISFEDNTLGKLDSSPAEKKSSLIHS